MSSEGSANQEPKPSNGSMAEALRVMLGAPTPSDVDYDKQAPKNTPQDETSRSNVSKNPDITVVNETDVVVDEKTQDQSLLSSFLSKPKAPQKYETIPLTIPLKSPLPIWQKTVPDTIGDSVTDKAPVPLSESVMTTTGDPAAPVEWTPDLPASKEDSVVLVEDTLPPDVGLVVSPPTQVDANGAGLRVEGPSRRQTQKTADAIINKDGKEDNRRRAASPSKMDTQADQDAAPGQVALTENMRAPETEEVPTRSNFQSTGTIVGSPFIFPSGGVTPEESASMEPETQSVELETQLPDSPYISATQEIDKREAMTVKGSGTSASTGKMVGIFTGIVIGLILLAICGFMLHRKHRKSFGPQFDEELNVLGTRSYTNEAVHQPAYSILHVPPGVMQRPMTSMTSMYPDQLLLPLNRNTGFTSVHSSKSIASSEVVQDGAMSVDDINSRMSLYSAFNTVKK